jgi:DNA-binding Lrp family transcriptional regulator
MTPAHHEQWTFLTNHAHVLLTIAQDPEIRVRDLAIRVGITERAAQRIVADLVAEGYLVRERVGRRNRYEVCPTRPLRHPVERHAPVGALMALLDAPRESLSGE